MGQSLAQMYIHLTFGTHNRYPFINLEWEEQLHAYVSGIFKNYESPVLSVNSHKDHIHVLFRLSKNHALAKVIENVKKDSSKWIKLNAHTQNFKWQAGYGAFSVSSSKINIVKQYILNQKEHHKKVSYQEEVESFFKNYEILDYDEEYFWR